MNVIEETKKIKWTLARLANEVRDKKNIKIRVHYFEDKDIDPKSEERMMDAFTSDCFGQFELLYANIRNKNVDFELRVCENGDLGFLFWLHYDTGKKLQDDPIVQEIFNIKYWKSYVWVIYEFFSQKFYEVKKMKDIKTMIKKELKRVKEHPY